MGFKSAEVAGNESDSASGVPVVLDKPSKARKFYPLFAHGASAKSATCAPIEQDDVEFTYQLHAGAYTCDFF